jgi:Predicted nucleotide-binding protein
MKIVVDTNIVFSALVKSDSAIAEMIICSHKKYKFFSSEFLLEELNNHHEKLKKASKLNDEQIGVARYRLFKYINFLSLELIPTVCWIKAEKLVFDIDPDDIAFVALSLSLNAYLWTGDKILYDGLKAKGFKNIMNTRDIIQYGLI